MVVVSLLNALADVAGLHKNSLVMETVRLE